MCMWWILNISRMLSGYRKQNISIMLPIEDTSLSLSSSAQQLWAHSGSSEVHRAVSNWVKSSEKSYMTWPCHALVPVLSLTTKLKKLSSSRLEQSLCFGRVSVVKRRECHLSTMQYTLCMWAAMAEVKYYGSTSMIRRDCFAGESSRSNNTVEISFNLKLLN